MEAILPELDYLAAEPVQHAISQRAFVHVPPEADTYKTDGDLKFDIKPSESSTALHESYLRVRCKIVKADGSACDHGATASPDDASIVNNLLHSMWKQVTVTLNGHEVEKIDNYPYRAYMSMLTSYSPEVMRVRGELHGWSKDTSGAFDDLSLATAGKNKGMKQRTTPFKNSTEVELSGRIESDVMNQGRNIPPNTRIGICLSRTSNAFVLMSSKTDASYKLMITDAEFVVARDKLAPSLYQAQEELSKKFNLAIDYRHCKITTVNVAQGMGNGYIKEVFGLGTRMPDRFVAFFVSNQAFTGTYGTNPFALAHHNVKYIIATVNDVTHIPQYGYKPNFTTGSVTNEYYALLREFNADEEDYVLDLCKSDFSNGFAIYPFRIVHRTRGGEVLGPVATGSVDIRYEFSTPLTSAATLVLVADYRSSFEIRATGDFAPPSSTST